MSVAKELFIKQRMIELQEEMEEEALKHIHESQASFVNAKLEVLTRSLVELEYRVSQAENEI